LFSVSIYALEEYFVLPAFQNRSYICLQN